MTTRAKVRLPGADGWREATALVHEAHAAHLDEVLGGLADLELEAEVCRWEDVAQSTRQLAALCRMRKTEETEEARKVRAFEL